MPHTFKKPEHLCLQNDIEALFVEKGHSVVVYPIRAVYRQVEFEGHGPQVKVLLSVSKRRLHHAVDRNRAKRQLREAYRLQKERLLTALPPQMGLHVAFVWLADKPIDSAFVSSKMRNVLARIAEKFQTESTVAPLEP